MISMTPNGVWPEPETAFPWGEENWIARNLIKIWPLGAPHFEHLRYEIRSSIVDLLAVRSSETTC